MATLELHNGIANDGSAPFGAETFRFNVTHFQRLEEIGFFEHEDRVELCAGRIVRMNPIGRDHAFSVSEINRHFAVLWNRAALWVQNPIIVDEENELIPDFSLIRLDVYRAGEIPRADAVHLVVEVAQTSRAYDQEIKAPLYARGGIPEYWLIDTRKRMILVHTEPSPRGYRQSRILNLSDIVSPRAFPDFQVKVADLLPTRQQD